MNRRHKNFMVILSGAKDPDTTKRYLGRMGFLTAFGMTVVFFSFLCASGASALTITNEGSAVIESKTSTMADTGGNMGQGNIVTGDASATSSSTIISSGGDTDVKASATAEANGKKSDMSVETKPDGGDISIEKSESTDSTQAQVEVNVSSDDGSDAPKEEGIFERIVSKVTSFLRNLFR